MTELTIEDFKEDAAKEENDMIVRRFVAMVGSDYIRYYEADTAQILPDWSDDTKVFWKEIESRLKEPTVLGFDLRACKDRITDKIESAKWSIAYGDDYTKSYHAGVKDGLYRALSIIDCCIDRYDDVIQSMKGSSTT